MVLQNFYNQGILENALLIVCLITIFIQWQSGIAVNNAL